ncbi:MAG: hypothetical protein Q4C30_04090 [Bacteroidia bacterium]|nr:hypothetical protein [Bacteroidia bacterium]
MSFSLKRFWQFVKADLTENRLTYLSVTVGSFVAMILMAVLFNQMAWATPILEDLKMTFNVFSLFIIVLTICLAFWDITSKGKFIGLVQKPASMFEKFIARLLFFAFLFPIVQRLFFIIVEWGRVIFCPRFDGDWFMSIYGREDGESFWAYYMGVDQAIGLAILFGWSATSLMIYFSSTFGGIKSFLHFSASFIFGLVVFVIILMMKAINMPMINTYLPNTINSGVVARLVLSCVVIFAASSLCIRSFVARNFKIKPGYKGIVSFAAMLLCLGVEMLVYSHILDLIICGCLEESVVWMSTLSAINLVWLLCGAYLNFAHRQLSDLSNR